MTRERCACGRTTARMGKVVGRTDDMFIISGVNVFPSTIESVLFQIEGVEPFYQIVLDRAGGLDTFEVQVEVTETLFDGWMDDLRAFERRVTEELRSALLVRPKVKLVEPGTLRAQRGQGPARHRQPAHVRRRRAASASKGRRCKRPASRRRPRSRPAVRRPSLRVAGLAGHDIGASAAARSVAP